MSAALYWIRFQQDWFGLISAISMGGAIYVLTAFVLDVGEMRTLVLRRWRNRLQAQVPALTDV
jgi:hypothetical protein